MTEQETPIFSWKYLGADEKYTDQEFQCPQHTKVVDDTDIFLPGSLVHKAPSREFFLDFVKGAFIHGYYFFRGDDDYTRKIQHKRTKGHVRPSSEFRK